MPKVVIPVHKNLELVLNSVVDPDLELSEGRGVGVGRFVCFFSPRRLNSSFCDIFFNFLPN